MKLEKKKELASRALGVGKNRIVFNTARLSELKEAITKQDIKDLKDQGVITIKEKKGRRTKTKQKTRRRMGSFKKKVKSGKTEYVNLTRKLREYLKKLKDNNKISKEDFHALRKEIRASSFRSLSHLKERISQMKEEK